MDTAAYLSRQGWRGDGHALHYSGRGITKPIRISQKANVYGVGKKKHDAHADQWWARAFDDTLKGLNATKDNITGETEGISLGTGAQALQMAGRGGARWVGGGGLYSNFVRGEGLNGTLTPEEKDSPERHEKTVGELEAEEECNLSRSRRKKTKKFKQVEPSRVHDAKVITLESKMPNPSSKPHDLQDGSGSIETKEERRRRRKERKAKKAI